LYLSQLRRKLEMGDRKRSLNEFRQFIDFERDEEEKRKSIGSESEVTDSSKSDKSQLFDKATNKRVNLILKLQKSDQVKGTKVLTKAFRIFNDKELGLDMPLIYTNLASSVIILNVLIGIRMEMMMWSQTLRHSKELQSTA
jgi:hypothetical protein